ncbi:MAG TPA: hypothetical protein VFX85_01250 [Solirubrobacterales bacterium]|nr:hypothetical protein [Solirubrobacterales bacterium]
MSEKRKSVLLTDDQIECIRTSLSYSAEAIRSQRYDPTDTDRVRRQRETEDMIASVKEALRGAER